MRWCVYLHSTTTGLVFRGLNSVKILVVPCTLLLCAAIKLENWITGTLSVYTAYNAHSIICTAMQSESFCNQGPNHDCLWDQVWGICGCQGQNAWDLKVTVRVICHCVNWIFIVHCYVRSILHGSFQKTYQCHLRNIAHIHFMPLTYIYCMLSWYQLKSILLHSTWIKQPLYVA